MSSFRLKDCRKYLKPGSIIILMLDVTGYSIPNPISVLILKLRISSVLPIYSLSLQFLKNTLLFTIKLPLTPPDTANNTLLLFSKYRT